MASLPPIRGPKLGRFSTKGAVDITFLQETGFGTDSVVYKVEINGQVYALKIVREIVGIFST